MSRHILLIDDEDDIREVTAVSLETVAGWRVTCARCGREGIDFAKQSTPDAILMDVMMPDQDGPTTLRLLQADATTARIPVIFLTAKIQPIEQERLGEMGAVGTLAKPFDPLSLAEQISALMGW
jgi:CheY-like chemotaxis protein